MEEMSFWYWFDFLAKNSALFFWLWTDWVSELSCCENSVRALHNSIIVLYINVMLVANHT
jgi:hypothetical protein